MKKNPGRKERRNLMFGNRRSAGKKRAAINEYRSSHYWLPKFRVSSDAREA